MADTTEKELADSVTLRSAEDADLTAATKAMLDPNDVLPVESKQDKSAPTSLLAPAAKPNSSQADSREASLIPGNNPGKKWRRGKPVLRAMRAIFAFVLAIPIILIAISGYELFTDPSASHILKSMIFEQIHDKKSQLSEMDAALKLKDNPLLRKKRADLFMSKRNIPAALDDYQRVLDGGFKNSNILINLVTCRMMSKLDDAETVKDIQQGFELSRLQEEKRWFVQILLLAGKYGDAQPLLDKLISANANSTWISPLDKLMRKNPPDKSMEPPDAWEQAIILERTGKLAEARAAYEAIDSGAVHTELSWSRAMFYLGGNELSKARAELDRQEKQHESNCSLRGLLEAWYSVQTGDYSRALAMSEMSTKNSINIGEYYREAAVRSANHKLRALVYEKQGDMKNLQKEKAQMEKYNLSLWHIYVPRNFN